MKKKLSFFTVFLTLAIIASAQIKKVAILETVDREGNVPYGVKLQLRSNLSYAISNTRDYDGLDRVDMASIMGEQNFQRTGMVSEEQIKKLGEITAASSILVAEAAVYDSTHIIITAKILNVETAAIENIAPSKVSGTDPESMEKACNELAAKLLGLEYRSIVLSEPTDPVEMSKLGSDYYWGRNGKKQDYSQAVYWYRKAIEHRFAKAQYNLGVCYEKGRGVSQDWYNAVYWYRKAAEQGYDNAQGNLGWCYVNGKGVSTDYSQALYWFRRGAEQGHLRSQYYLGLCYAEGKGVSQDWSSAAYWYRKAAEQGYANAQNNLGSCYRDGKGVTQDYVQAAYWYRRAAEQDNVYGQTNLGWCYESGKGVIKDRSQSVYWYRKAAEQGNNYAKDALKRLE